MTFPDNNTLSQFLNLSAVAANFNKRIDNNLSIIHGIGVTEFSVMHTLQAAPNCTMSRIDLANGIGLSASGVTRLLNPMEKIGLVEKERNTRDARVSLVKLSNAGKRIYQEALATTSSVCDHLYQDLSHAQQNTLGDLIARLK